jgi:hypothetical protein
MQGRSSRVASRKAGAGNSWGGRLGASGVMGAGGEGEDRAGGPVGANVDAPSRGDKVGVPAREARPLLADAPSHLAGEAWAEQVPAATFPPARPGPMPRWFRSGQPGAEIPLPRFLARLGLELLVVFIGVYAAFALSEHEDRRDDAVRRVQLQAALVREIEALTMNTRRVAETLPERLAQFDAAVAAGARPPLSPLIEAVRVDTHMWEAALQSSALDLFAVDTVYDLSRFYNELNAGFEQLAQLRALSETVLIPNLGLDSG